MNEANDRPNADAEFEFASATSRPSTQNPLTTALLFYLVTVGGIISACLRAIMGNDSFTIQSFQQVLVGGVVLGFLSGGLIGLFYLKSGWATVICAGMGIVVGAIASGLAMVGSESFYSIALIAFGGCWLLVLVMLLSARFRAESGK